MAEPLSIVVRSAVPADSPALSALSRRVFVETFCEDLKILYDPQDLAAFLDKAHGPDSFARTAADPAHGLWAAFLDGTLAGYASAGPMSLPHPDARPEHGELYRLYVPRPFQGEGVAQTLMATALNFMTDRPVQWIGVWSGNIRAQRFYARFGFEKAGEYDYPVGRTIDREFILRR